MKAGGSIKNLYASINEIKTNKITDAQNSLFRGLIKLWKKKSKYKINVKELSEISHIARSTFYVYYQNIDELIEDLENYHILKLIELNKTLMNSEVNVEEYLLYYQETIEYVEINKELFYAFLIANVNNNFIKKWKDAIKYHLLERESSLRDNKNCHLVLEMVASQVIAAYSFWLENPNEVDIDSLDKIVIQTIKLIEF